MSLRQPLLGPLNEERVRAVQVEVDATEGRRATTAEASAGRFAVRHMRPENADDVLKVGRSFLVGVWRRETVRWKAIAYSYPVH